MFFFFKQKTAYEMRISDWSSDVCSSDLAQRGAVDQHELARRPDAVQAAQFGMHLLGDLAAVQAAAALLDPPLAVLQQRAVQEPRPDVQHVDGLAPEVVEPPALVGVDRQRLVVVAQRPVQVDDRSEEHTT